MENRGVAVVESVVTGYFFGLWQNSLEAGVFMAFLLVTFAIIKTVK